MSSTSRRADRIVIASKSNDDERAEFQQLLDDRFPIGGLCVTFLEQEGRLRPTGDQFVTGRLVCTAAKPSEAGGWLHQLLVDPRLDTAEQVTPLVAWIEDLDRHETATHLWQARINSESENHWLRINAAPAKPLASHTADEKGRHRSAQ